MTHTPGPWTLNDKPTFGMHGWKITTNNRLVPDENLNGWEFIIVPVAFYDTALGENSYNDPRNLEQLANARLIAAAPELLEALEAAVASEHHTHCSSRKKSINCNCHVGIARDAIAKALVV